ncbi:PEPxxWA-CTERM sorting domain-containing protein [uncultured Sphingomonas sp.]|uniref:PEPxxWA-CTERM sorting domain-containing protein n=1 Tax=uncultured Sphingomonas sp. TaxID=158754 RepID=UPI0035C991DA
MRKQLLAAIFAVTGAQQAGAQDYGLDLFTSASHTFRLNDSERYSVKNGDRSRAVGARVAASFDPYPTGTADAFASANLATGELKASAATNRPCDQIINCLPTGAYAQAGFSDTLRFTIPGATSTTITSINMAFSSIGEFINGASPSTLQHILQGTFYNQGLSNGAGFNILYQNGSVNTGVGGFNTHQITSAIRDNFGITVSYDLYGATPDLSLALTLYAIANDGGIADFGRTARVGLTLPEGVTYTSASGVFLTAVGVPGAVPEPATWASMILGFGLVGGALRRARARTTASTVPAR